MKIIDATVIIPTLNRAVAFERTIMGYLASPTLPAQIIAADQSNEVIFAENEKLRKAIESRGIEFLHLSLPQPSLTKARNAGMKKATGSLLVFSDDDVDVRKNTLEIVAKVFDDSSVALAGAYDGLASDTTKTSLLSLLAGTKKAFSQMRGYVTASMLGRFPANRLGRKNTEWAMGFFFVTRRNLIEKWGLTFDENLSSYAYAEDLDFTFSVFKKAKKEGMGCYYFDELVVDHLASKEFRIPTRKNIFMYVINRRYLAFKHGKSALACRWTDFFMTLFMRKKGLAPLYKQARTKAIKIQKELKAGVIPLDAYSE